MDGIVKKKAILDATKSNRFNYWLKDYKNVVPCTVHIGKEVKNGLVHINLDVPKVGRIHLEVLADLVFINHRTIKSSIPMSLWNEAENFGKLRRMARQREREFDGEDIKALGEVDKKLLAGNKYGSIQVVNLCYDKGLFECDFCHEDNDLTADHIIPRGWKHSRRFKPLREAIKFIKIYSKSNLQVLCKSCHKEKTKFEINLINDNLDENRRLKVDSKFLIESILEYGKKRREEKEKCRIK